MSQSNIPERQRVALIAFFTRQKVQLEFESTQAADVYERQAANEMLIETQQRLESLKAAKSAKEGIPA